MVVAKTLFQKRHGNLDKASDCIRMTVKCVPACHNMQISEPRPLGHIHCNIRHSTSVGCSQETGLDDEYSSNSMSSSALFGL